MTRRLARPDKDLRRVAATQAQLATGHLEKARSTTLEHLHPAASPQAEFRHAANPGGIAANVSHVRPFTGTQQFEWQLSDRWHCGPSQLLLRLNLNYVLHDLDWSVKPPVPEMKMLTHGIWRQRFLRSAR
jgi:hypothetical protein